MNQDQLIQELSEKLGTTTEYLWGILINQAPIAAGIGIASFIGLLFLTGILGFLAHKRADKQRYSDDIFQFLLTLSALFCALMTVIYAFTELPNAYIALVNPEYWALKQIIK